MSTRSSPPIRTRLKRSVSVTAEKLAERFANQQRTRAAAIDEIIDLL